MVPQKAFLPNSFSQESPVDGAIMPDSRDKELLFIPSAPFAPTPQEPCRLPRLAPSREPDSSTLQEAMGQRSASVRVLHLINGQHYAGAERVQDLLAQRLPEFGFQVGFGVVKPGVFGQRRHSQHAPLYETPMRFRFDLRPAPRLARIIRQEGYRLLHAHTPRTLWVGSLAAWLARVPLVYHVHSPASADSTRWFFNWANAAVERLALRAAAGVICVSEALAQQIRQWGLPEGNITVVPNGVPPAHCFWTPRTPSERGLSDDRPDRESMYKFPKDGFKQATGSDQGLLGNPAPFDPYTWTIGTVALFRPRKGIEVLLEALALLDRHDVPVRLRAVGPFETASYEVAVRQRVLQLGLAGRVEWAGEVENVEAELTRMDLFVLPSLFGEGLPMVLLEAMAVGVPIVASRIAGIDEVIRDNEEGLLVPPGNPQGLAEAIRRILTPPGHAARLSANARKRYSGRYSDQAMAAGVAEVYRRILLARCR